MRNHSTTLFGLAALAALLVGCGGGGSDAAGASTLAVGGGATLLSRTNDADIVAGSLPTTHMFGGTEATVPAGIAVPTGSVAILTTATPVLALSGSGGFTVNGQATGLSLANGSLSANVALPPTGAGTVYAISAAAPVGGFKIGTDSHALTIRGAVRLGAPVLGNGAAGIPTAISGNVPANGSSSAGVVVHATYPAAFASIYNARLTISWTANGVDQTITQTQAVPADGRVTFSPSVGGTIPTSGVDVLKIELIAL